MRNMSFALTTDQFEDGSKDVTRRLGWANVPAGTHVMGVRKGQGLKKGEKVQRLGEIVLVDVRRERLSRMLTDIEYGKAEVIREGFPHLSPQQFVQMFCAHNGCQPRGWVTRIEFTINKQVSAAAMRVTAALLTLAQTPTTSVK